MGVGTVLVFLWNLQKTFDVVNHDILLEKLKHYGVRGIPHQLLKSFLSDRCQYIKLNNVKSNILEMPLGTPQGSILSPLLFLLFINDLVKAVLSYT